MFCFSKTTLQHMRSCTATDNIRDEPKGDGPKVTDPNLWFPAVSCEKASRFSPVFLRPPNAWRRGASVQICGFLQKSAF